MVDKQPDERVGSDGETYFDPEKYQEQFEHDELEPVVLIPSDENLVVHKPSHPPKSDVIEADIVPFESANQINREIVIWCDDCFPQKSFYRKVFSEVE